LPSLWPCSSRCGAIGRKGVQFGIGVYRTKCVPSRLTRNPWISSNSNIAWFYITAGPMLLGTAACASSEAVTTCTSPVLLDVCLAYKFAMLGLTPKLPVSRSLTRRPSHGTTTKPVCDAVRKVRSRGGNRPAYQCHYKPLGLFSPLIHAFHNEGYCLQYKQ
jgi:hypothetical protein